MLDEHKRSRLGKGYQGVYAMGETRAPVHVQGENNLTRIETLECIGYRACKNSRVAPR